jgi:hypothetical protein
MLITGNSKTCKAYRMSCKRTSSLVVATIHTCVLFSLCKYMFMNHNKTVRSDRMLISIRKETCQLITRRYRMIIQQILRYANIWSFQMVLVIGNMQIHPQNNSDVTE